MQIDNVYLISLPERTDRLRTAALELSEYPFQIYTACKDKDGRKGLKMTMISLLKDAVYHRYENILVFEDDVKLYEKKETIHVCMEQLPDNYELLFLGANLFKQPEKYSTNLLRLTGAVANHAVLYNASVFQMLINIYTAQLHTTTPTDILLNDTVIRFGNSYITNPLIATQHSGYSDIEHREVNYDSLLVDRYQEATKKIQHG